RGDVEGDEVLAGGGGEAALEPRLAGDVEAEHAAVAVGAAVGDDGAVDGRDPEVEVHGVGVEDHPEATAGVVGAAGAGAGVGAGADVDHGGVGGPPPHVAG